MGLVSKLAEVMGTCGWVQKSGYNEFHKYPYAQEADIVNMLRGELAKRQIMVFPDVKAVKRTEHVTETMKWNATTRTNEPTTRKTYITEITVEWRFIDGESNECHTVTCHGVGEDNMDKGFYKAFTGCCKYMFMKTFLLPTGDDPEKDSQEEKEVAKERGKVAAADKAKEKIADLQHRQTQHVTIPPITIADLEKAMGNIPKDKVPEEYAKPQLTVVQVGENKYQVTGALDVMKEHRDDLLHYGKYDKNAKGDQPVVIMTGQNLADFRHIFVDKKGGELHGLQATWAKS